jgi:acetyl-CoA carboxylase biotin carboxyl carrier protein
VKFDFDELRELLSVLNQTDVAELTLKGDDFELILRKGSWVADATLVPPAAPPAAGAPLPSPSGAPASSAPPSEAIAPPSPAPSSAGAPAPLSDTKYVEVLSPMVGTFYRAPSPDEPSYVNVGDRIQVGQTICIIEAMKLMNELEAEVAGEVIEVLVQNAEPVEYGQVLMRVKPN